MATVNAESAISVSLSEATNRFLSRAGKQLINGQWKEAQSGETFEVFNPATGESIAHCAAGAKDDIDAAVLRAIATILTEQQKEARLKHERILHPMH